MSETPETPAPEPDAEPAAPDLGVTQAESLFDLGARPAPEPEALPTTEELQQSFPQYEILELLGRGGMGVVYKARQRALDRLVALKLLPPALGADPGFAARFQREARAMARLNHPNIITVHDFGQTAEGRLYFTMEFVEGANLQDLIRSGTLRFSVGSVSPPDRADRPIEPTLHPSTDVLSIIAQICDALACAHGQGIVHRDIKPANVMIDFRGRVKVADFGLARLIDAEVESGLTMTGTVMGTLDYMAPEQRRGEHVDHRADIYALGVMFYEMLCREVPHGMFDPPSTRIGCDPRLDRIVATAMQSEPDRRFQSTQEMHAAIETARTAVLVPVPAPPRALGVTPPRPPVPGNPPGVTPGVALALRANPAGALALASPRRRATVIAVAIAVLVLLVAGGWWFVSGKKHAPVAGASVVRAETSATPAPAERWVDLLREPQALRVFEGGSFEPSGLSLPPGVYAQVSDGLRKGHPDGAVRFRSRFDPAVKALFAQVRSKGGNLYALFLSSNGTSMQLQQWNGPDPMRRLADFTLPNRIAPGQGV